MNFQTILTQLKLGTQVYRTVWNQNNRRALYLYVPANTGMFFLVDSISGAEFPYTLTTKDLLAEDWEVVSV